MNSNDLVIEKNPTTNLTLFYLLYYDGNEHNNQNKNIEPRKTFFVVKKSRYSIKDLTGGPVIKLLDFGDMALYQAVDSVGK